jgi:hypothetical protein
MESISQGSVTTKSFEFDDIPLEASGESYSDFDENFSIAFFII